jgi:hypothetical protein
LSYFGSVSRLVSGSWLYYYLLTTQSLVRNYLKRGGLGFS